ncbi:hypothetical protein [Longimycelium tulufanense]|nr:hypothetical protein [Longimycelium tulufanense]
MTKQIEFTDHIHYNGGLCTVQVRGRGESADNRLDVEIFSADTEGQLTGEGHLSLPVGALVPAAQLLPQALTGIAQLHGINVGKLPRTARGRPGNSFQPWTSELDERLRTAWMSGDELLSAYELTGRLATEFDRSRNAIRSRLARLGCDPDIPGRELTVATAPTTNAINLDNHPG